MCGAKRHGRFTPESDRKSGHRGTDRGQSIFLLCPFRLNVSLLRYGKGIIHIDAEVTDSTLDLRVT